MLNVQARAKINWTLDVLGTLPNGYHDLDMLMQSVTLCDQMTFREADKLTLSVSSAKGIRVPADSNNLVLRAARALQEAAGTDRGAAISLRKYIPVAAGMGGGSSDAAAVLVALNRLWNLGLSPDELETIGLSVGADVPFCIRGGLQRARGVGEKLTPLTLARPLYLIAFQPCYGLSTREVFGALHEEGIRPEDRPDTDSAQAALLKGDAVTLGKSLGNVLEPVSRRLRPDIDRAINDLVASGAVGARMTGSGSAVFGLYRDYGACRRAMETLSVKWPAARIMRTAEEGIGISEETGDERHG